MKTAGSSPAPTHIACQTGDLSRAESLARTFTDPAYRGSLLAQLAQAAARAGDLKRAQVATLDVREAVQLVGAAALAATDPREQSRSLADAALIAAEIRDLSWAGELTRAIPDQGERARALVTLAEKARPDQARSLLGQALATDHWTTTIDALARVSPDAVAAIADLCLSSPAVNELAD